MKGFVLERGYVREDFIRDGLCPHNGGLIQNERVIGGCTGQRYEAGGGSQNVNIGDAR